MLRLYLVRHGETAWNVQRRYQGQSDLPLSDVGVEQAEALACRLADEKFDAIYASDLKRAWETANAIAEKSGLAVISEPRLREMNFGIIEGLTFDEAQTRYPKVMAAWLKNYNQPPPDGEPLNIVSARVLSLLDDLQKKHADQTICLVAHGGPLSEIIRLVLELPAERRWSFAMDNASLSELILGENGHPVLKRLNDTNHLV